MTNTLKVMTKNENHLIYQSDVNNLNGWEISQKLPLSGFK